jgi:hypothetical protein
VSIKYTVASCTVLYPSEILILSDIGHVGEDFHETLAVWLQQQLFEHCTMLSLQAPTVPGSAFFERIDNTRIQVSHDERSHRILPRSSLGRLQ